MARNYGRASFESVPGNEANSPTLSTAKMWPRAQSIQINANPKQDDRDDELGGDNQPQAVSIDTFEPDWAMKGRLYPNQLAFTLKHMFGAPTYTAGNGVITDPDSVVIPTGAHRWVWTAPFGPTGLNPLTMQIDGSYVEEAVFVKARGCAMQEFSIETPPEGSAMFEASGPAAYVARVADPALTPVPDSVAIQPFKFKGLDIVTDLASAAAAAGFTFKANNPVKAERTLSAASYFPDVVEYDDDELLVCTAEIDRRHLSAADIDALLAASGFPLKARWTSDSLITGAYPYKLYIEFSNAQYVDEDRDEVNNSRRSGNKLTLKSTTAGSASTTITLINGVSTLS